MKKFLLLLPLFASCVTTGDLEEIKAIIGDQTMTVEEQQVAITEVQERVEKRTDNFVASLSDAQAGGLAGTLMAVAGIGANLYRNRKRKLKGEPI